MKRTIFTTTVLVIIAAQLPFVTMAATSQTINITDPKFKFVMCNGPDLSKLPRTEMITINQVEYIPGTRSTKITPFPYTGGSVYPEWYHPCDFNALVDTAQHLINIIVSVGVFAALGSFVYIGFLYIEGTEKGRTKVKDMFPKMFKGFILMLSAWFIVYQLLGWLGASEGFRSLLGSPLGSP